MTKIQLNFPTATFLEDIEKLVTENKLSQIDAILHWCELNNIEIEAVASLINSNKMMKAKIQREAENLNFIPKSINKPI